MKKSQSLTKTKQNPPLTPSRLNKELYPILQTSVSLSSTSRHPTKPKLLDSTKRNWNNPDGFYAKQFRFYHRQNQLLKHFDQLQSDEQSQVEEILVKNAKKREMRLKKLASKQRLNKLKMRRIALQKLSFQHIMDPDVKMRRKVRRMGASELQQAARFKGADNDNSRFGATRLMLRTLYDKKRGIGLPGSGRKGGKVVFSEGPVDLFEEALKRARKAREEFRERYGDTGRTLRTVDLGSEPKSEEMSQLSLGGEKVNTGEEGDKNQSRKTSGEGGGHNEAQNGQNLGKIPKKSILKNCEKTAKNTSKDEFNHTDGTNKGKGGQKVPLGRTITPEKSRKSRLYDMVKESLRGSKSRRSRVIRKPRASKPLSIRSLTTKQAVSQVYPPGVVFESLGKEETMKMFDDSRIRQEGGSRVSKSLRKSENKRNEKNSEKKNFSTIIDEQTSMVHPGMEHASNYTAVVHQERQKGSKIDQNLKMAKSAPWRSKSLQRSSNRSRMARGSQITSKSIDKSGFSGIKILKISKNQNRLKNKFFVSLKDSMLLASSADPVKSRLPYKNRNRGDLIADEVRSFYQHSNCFCEILDNQVTEIRSFRLSDARKIRNQVQKPQKTTRTPKISKSKISQIQPKSKTSRLPEPLPHHPAIKDTPQTVRKPSKKLKPFHKKRIWKKIPEVNIVQKQSPWVNFGDIEIENAYTIPEQESVSPKNPK